ncbi:UMP kinase [Candidatus Woesearchaeota archaeon]|nr:UMP kinase [Candidatus Woesearchaeota archaeon]MBU3942021.1 UMP kinase [Nanoarchaeota archaeon]
MAKTIVISLGGSIIVPDKINIKFLKGFKKLITDFVEKENKAIIVCGGGNTARKYQSAAGKISNLRNDDLDWMGIHTTRLNAQLVKTLFLGDVHEFVIHDPNDKIEFKEHVLIAAGWKPGWSTDYDAIRLANNFNVKTVINISDVPYVYDKSPKNNGDAKPIKKMSWKELRKLVGDKWDPGLNVPFDPIAAKEGEKLGIKVIVIGTDLINIKNCMEGKEFDGTVIN